MFLVQVSFWRGDLRHQKYLEGRFAVQVSRLKSDLYQKHHRPAPFTLPTYTAALLTYTAAHTTRAARAAYPPY